MANAQITLSLSEATTLGDLARLMVLADTVGMNPDRTSLETTVGGVVRLSSYISTLQVTWESDEDEAGDE